MAFRSPFNSLGEGIGQGLRDLAQTLIGARQREQELADQRAREEAQRAFTAQENARQRESSWLQTMMGQDFNAQQNQLTRDAAIAAADVAAQRGVLGTLLGGALQAGQQAGSVTARGGTLPEGMPGQISELIAGLAGAAASPASAFGGVPGLVGEFAGPLASVTGSVAGAGSLLDQREALQTRNWEQFTAAASSLRDPSLNLGTAQGMASFLLNAQTVRMLSSADMPAGVDVATMVGWVDRMEDMINADPQLKQLRDDQLSISGSNVVLAAQQVAQAQINTALLGMDMPLKQLTIEEATERIAGLKAQNATDAYAIFEQTGLIPEGYESRVRAMYEASRARNPNMPEFDAFQNTRFASYTERLEAERELLQVEVQIGRDSVTLSSLAVDQARYEQQYRDLDRFIAMQGNAGELIGAALSVGDTAAIRRMMVALKNPESDPGMHRFLTEAGISLDYLQSKLTEVTNIKAYNDRAMEFARAELDDQFATLALTAATRPMMAALEMQNALAGSMTPEQIGVYRQTLTPEQRAILGGDLGLEVAATRAKLRVSLEQNEQTAAAMDYVMTLKDLPISEANQASVAMHIFGHLVDAGVDSRSAEAIAVGFRNNWELLGREEAQAKLESDTQIALWNAQSGYYGRMPGENGGDGSSGPGLTFDEWVDVLDSERQALAERRQNLRTQQENGGCVAVTGVQGIINDAPNRLPNTFNPLDPNADRSSLTAGQLNCANLAASLYAVDGQLVEITQRYRNLYGVGDVTGGNTTGGNTGGVYTGSLYEPGGAGAPGTGVSHPLHTWDLSGFTADEQVALFTLFDMAVADGYVDPGDAQSIQRFMVEARALMDQANGAGSSAPPAAQSAAPAAAGVAPAQQQPTVAPEMQNLMIQSVVDAATLFSGNQPTENVPIAQSMLGRLFNWVAPRVMPSIVPPGFGNR